MDHGLDLIGDIHGHAAKLVALLAGMGYAETDGVWRHPTRKAVFLGDFVDRGPDQVGVYRIARAMIEAGEARAVMGNHEFNAIAFHTPDGRGGFLRERSHKNTKQHQCFIDQVGLDSPLHDEIIAWFMELPLWLDLGDVRAVHACWDEASMEAIAPMLRQGNRLTPELVAAASDGHGNSYAADGSASTSRAEFRAVETLLKGVEIKMPTGSTFTDADGHVRDATRIRWWNRQAASFLESALLTSRERAGFPADLPMPAGVARGYDGDVPLFIGHYWMTDEPTVLAPNLACVDYSAGKGGPLVAYRWSGERELDDANFFAATA